MGVTPFDGHLARGPAGSAGEDIRISGSRKRKSYPPAYRREAAHLVIDTGRPIVQVAREIGVGEALLGRWVAVEQAWTDPPEALDVDGGR